MKKNQKRLQITCENTNPAECFEELILKSYENTAKNGDFDWTITINPILE